MQTAGRWRRCRQCARMVQYIGCDVAWLGAVLSGGWRNSKFQYQALVSHCSFHDLVVALEHCWAAISGNRLSRQDHGTNFLFYFL